LSCSANACCLASSGESAIFVLLVYPLLPTYVCWKASIKKSVSAVFTIQLYAFLRLLLQVVDTG
jgi:hypothetical protein